MSQANSSPRSITAALAQHAPVFLNLHASLDKAKQVIGDAADSGADIITFPECWLAGYPVWLDFADGAALWDHSGAKQLFRLLSENSVIIGDQICQELNQLSDEKEIIIVIGVHEKKGGTLYNTSLTFVPGIDDISIHRKLVPTYTERLVWGRGDGSTLQAASTKFGNIGTMICWEHWMPHARAAMHAQNEILHVAQWPIVKDMHLVASRHYAFEGRVPVLASGSILSFGDVMSGFNSLKVSAPEAEKLLRSMENDTHWIHTGGSTAVAANGDLLTPQVFNREETVYTQIDLNTAQEERLTLDTDGHYSRPDIFELTVNTKPQPGVRFD